MNRITFLGTIAPFFLLATTMMIPTANAATSAYDSGFKHGVSDANGGDYILQPGKGFQFHTQTFNQGYIDGWCSIEGPGASSDADEATFDCSEATK
jgi:hypothetical protein